MDKLICNRRNKRILVYGDAMIDEYIYGNVSRVSPEAPVPVVKAKLSERKIGGAGNVTNNISSLGCEVAGLFLIGKDKESDFLIDYLIEKKIKTDWILRTDEINTIKKTRVIGNHQQVVRIDYNDQYILNDSQKKQIESLASEALDWCELLIISDYDKGMCDKEVCEYLIREAIKRDIIIIVDPKGTDWEKYRGATIITPNMNEINTFSGKNVENKEEDIVKEYSSLPQMLGIACLLITRSEKGMTIIKNNYHKTFEAVQRKVFDVSGAGDTVVATLAVFLDNEIMNIENAVYWANMAAGIVVGKPGTAVVTESELCGELEKSLIRNKIFKVEDRNSLKILVDSWRGKGETFATTNGCFDILHKGHISLLEEANKLADHLIVLLNSDDSVKKLKGDGRPINSETDRAFLLAALSAVDAVAIFDPLSDETLLTDEEWESIPSNMLKVAKGSPIGILKILNPDIHVKGGDYEEKDVPETKFAKKFQALCFIEGYSTTNLVRKVGEI